MKIQYRFGFIDTSYSFVVKNGSLDRVHRCFRCKRDDTLGYIVSRHVQNPSPTSPIVHPSMIGFACIHCAFPLLREHGYPVYNQESLCLFSSEIPRNYARAYRRFHRGLIERHHYELLENIYTPYMYKPVIFHIQKLTQLDIDYSNNKHRGTEWDGWWQRRSGDCVEAFLTLLKGFQETGASSIDPNSVGIKPEKTEESICVTLASEVHEYHLAVKRELKEGCIYSKPSFRAPPGTPNEVGG